MRRSGISKATTAVAAMLFVCLLRQSMAQIGGEYSYTAELETQTQRQGAVFAGGLNWSCRLKTCTTDTNYASLSLETCMELASQVGKIQRFGRLGWRFGQNDLRWCNSYAAAEGVREPGISIGGGPGQPTARIPLPGGSPKTGEGDAEGGAGAPAPAEPPRIERIEYRAGPGGIELFIRGAHFPTPREGRTIALLPTKRSYCLGVCEQQYQPYEAALGAAQPAQWHSDLLSIELPAFATDPYTPDQFLAQLLTMVESHYVEIRSGAGQPVASTTLPISRFGELDTDVDRDGHRDRRLGGDDCDDNDATLTTTCGP